MNPHIILALQLLLAHILTDFVFQTNKLVKQKEEKKGRAPFLYVHSFLAGLFTYIIIQDWTLWWVPVLISVSHFFIDLWKLNQENGGLKYFLLDQFFHLLILLFIWLGLTSNFDHVIPYISELFTSTKFLAIIIGYLIVIYPLGFIIGMATQRWQDELAEDEELTSLKKAGRYIGIFERILVLTFILSNNFSAIGFLIGAKSILRFSEKGKSGARKQTEYVLIGTLMSFALTIVIGFLVSQFVL